MLTDLCEVTDGVGPNLSSADVGHDVGQGKSQDKEGYGERSVLDWRHVFDPVLEESAEQAEYAAGPAQKCA